MKAQDIKVSLEDALKICKPSFKKKLLHTIELLRKAENLALKYDSEDGFYLAFSAGKDSQALYHAAVMGG